MVGTETKKQPKVKYVFRDDSLYDTEGLRKHGSYTKVRLFCGSLNLADGSGMIDAKGLSHTNLVQPSTIQNPMRFKPQQLSLVITGASVNDANFLASHGMLEFSYRGRPKFRSPLSRFFAVTNGALRRTSELVYTPANWLQRLLFPKVVLERQHEVMDDAVLRYAPQSFKSIPQIDPGEAFDVKIDLHQTLVPEHDILIRLICSGQMGEPESAPSPYGYPLQFGQDETMADLGAEPVPENETEKE